MTLDSINGTLYVPGCQLRFDVLFTSIIQNFIQLIKFINQYNFRTVISFLDADVQYNQVL